jgi:hypothetical protein
MDMVTFPYVCESPNAPIPIVSGETRLVIGATTSVGDGQFSLVWQPTPRVILETDREMTYEQIEHLNDAGIEYELHGRSRTGKCRLIQASVGEASSEGQHVAATWYVEGEFFLDSPAPTAEVVLGVVNFPNCLNWESVNHKGGMWRGGLTLTVEPYKIEFQTIDHGVAAFNELVRLGGYAVTHVVRVTRSDLKAIEFEKAEHLRWVLRNFLTFLRGKRVGIPTMISIHDGTTCWESWMAVDAAPFANETSWFPMLLTSPHAEKTIASLPDVAAFFVNYDDNGNDRGLLLAIDWYAQSFGSTRVDTRIALIGAGLEQIAWWSLVLGNWIGEEGFGKLTLGDALGICMARASVSPELPAELEPIVGTKITKTPRGAHLIAEARNSVIHPKSKHFDIQALDIQQVTSVSEYAAKQFELLLLSALNYRGAYRDRMNAREEALVPWAV